MEHLRQDCLCLLNRGLQCLSKRGLLDVAAAMFDEDFANRCLPFDRNAANHYAAIVPERTQQGKPTSVEDTQIASIARANRLSLATRNGKDFANIEGLVVLNPW